MPLKHPVDDPLWLLQSVLRIMLCCRYGSVVKKGKKKRALSVFRLFLIVTAFHCPHRISTCTPREVRRLFLLAAGKLGRPGGIYTEYGVLCTPYILLYSVHTYST